LNSRGVLIVVHSVRAAILDLTTDAITPEVSLVNVVVQGCSFVVTPKASVLKSMDIARPTKSFVRQHYVLEETPTTGTYLGEVMAPWGVTP